MRNKRFKKTNSSLIKFIIPIIIILVIVGIIVFIYKKGNTNTKKYNQNDNSLIGTFLYEENKTKYSFKEDGTGSMSSDEYSFNYEYKYTVKDNTLIIDFAKEEVHDVTYSFELNNETLKLISEEGTVSVGEEYILKKENK